jgi:MFS transporter, DHA1 family, multidrug resistance protein
MFQALVDTPAGQLLRLCGFKSSLYYPEESLDFDFLSCATVSEAPVAVTRQESKICAAAATDDSPEQEEKHSDAIIVTWYSPDDEDNPRDWSSRKKIWVIVIISLYTFVVYCTASIITPTAESVIQKYDISIDVATLGLSLYVFGYAAGPMLWSPLSEIRFIGRNPVYLYGFSIFLIISVMIAVIDNFPTIYALRFLQGYLGSPAQATSAASTEDIYNMYSAPYGYV